MNNAVGSRVRHAAVALAVGLGAVLALTLAGPVGVASRPSAPWCAQMLPAPVLAFSLQTTGTIYLPLVCRCWTGSDLPLGVQFYGALGSSSGLDQIAAGGAHWIRVPLSWASIEPSNTTPDSYSWSALDGSVANAAGQGIDLILTIAGQPSWAAVYAMGPVTNTADILEFVGALVERYDADGALDAPGSTSVQYFELYNEPDNADVGHAAHGGWGYWGHNAAGYAELLEALYPVVKAASPSANLVFGGLALDWFEPLGPFDPQFLQDVLAACQGQSCFDVMNFHYYPPFRANWDPYGPDIIGKANYVRQKLAQFGFCDVPVICTETSWYSGAAWGSDELQSRYVVKGYVRGSAAGLPIVIWYKAHDLGDSGLPGLLDVDLQPKPSYHAFQTTAAMLAGAAYQRALTSVETGSTQIEGYMFAVCGRRLDVVWTEDGTPYDAGDDPVLPFRAQAGMVRVVDKAGGETYISDGDDGVVDGWVTVSVGGSPIFIEYH